MSCLTRKFVAVLVLLWLPLFSGSALAATVSMQMPQGSCHESADMQSMTLEDMAQHHHNDTATAATDEHAPACNACGVCHLACTGYLGAPDMDLIAVEVLPFENTLNRVSFRSITFVPLLPPPLTRA